MPQIIMDSLLADIFERAAKIGSEHNGIVSAERFAVCLIDTEREAGDAVLSAAVERMRACGVDVENTRQRLFSQLCKDAPTFLDDLYMKNIISTAARMAQDRGVGSIGVSDVLDCILRDPANKIGAQSPSQTAVVSDRQPPSQKSVKEQIVSLTDRVKNIRARLAQKVYGQDYAVSVFTSGYFRAEMLSLTDKERTRPAATYLFAGPPGVGKTYLAEVAADILGLPFVRFDMSEYCDKEAAIEFCGSDSVYKNSKSGNFTDFVKKNPKCVVLFDEIEKAHISIIHLFLQMLDAGRIRDSKSDEEISLKDVIMIFTTNAGRALYEYIETDDLSTLSRKVILDALQKDINPVTSQPYFPPAICSRFASGNVVMFNRLTAHDLRSIVKGEILRRAECYTRETGVAFEIDEKVYSAILFSEAGSADGRSARARAEAFFDNELYELFGLVGGNGEDISRIEKIGIDVILPEDETIRDLFVKKKSNKALLYLPREEYERCCNGGMRGECILVEDLPQARKLLCEDDIDVIVIDPVHGLKNAKDYLNPEDEESTAKDLFRYCREMHPDIPVYFVQSEQRPFGDEQTASFARMGVRGILSMGGCGCEFCERLEYVCEQAHANRSAAMLASSSRVLSYGTAQRLCEEGKRAEIRCFDFRTVIATEAEDTEFVLSQAARPNISFDSVIGAKDAKAELSFFVDYLRSPKKYRATGMSAPKGVLLWGPPGTGKTMLAGAMACESDVTFIVAEGNQFLKKYAGEGPELVHKLFKKARKYAPSILFIDEIDAIGKMRTGASTDGSEEILTAFLTEMDGFKNNPSRPVFVLAATNYDIRSGSTRTLDPALLRRFDRRVHIGLPDRNGRVRFIRHKVEGNMHFALSDEMIENLALRSTSMSLAELEHVLELALRNAIRTERAQVTDEVLDHAFETYNNGEKKDWDEKTLDRVARHEAGHTFMCIQSGNTPSYVTVVSRAGHGGYMQYSESEEKLVYTRGEILCRIRTALGGCAAERVYYGQSDGMSTGASQDLAIATELAQRLVCMYGMDESFGLAAVNDKDVNGGTLARDIRDAVNGILSSQMKEAEREIEANREAVDRIACALIEKNHLTGEELCSLLVDIT